MKAEGDSLLTPPYVTCWRRFKKWVEDGSLVKAWQALPKMFDQNQQLDLETLIADGTFATANSHNLFANANVAAA
jgi:hypothetical protein